LPYWEAADPITPAMRAAWLAAANRIASGLEYLAHLPVTVDPDLLVVAFSCGEDGKLAARYVDVIERENLEARLIEAGDGSYGVALPCRPEATDDEIKHTVLAGVKAAHALEFVPITDPDVLAQLQLVQAVEACFVDLGKKMKGAGRHLRQGLGHPKHA
jgi:hypothetical protein